MKKGIYFAANYLIVIQLAIMLWAAFYETTFIDGVATVFTGGLLALCAWLISFVMKHIIKRLRPGNDLQLFKTFDSYSFPSSHATVLAALSVFVFMLQPTFGIAAFIVASLIGAARGFAHVHYASDVLAGIVLGFFIGYVGTPILTSFVETLAFIHV